MTNQLQPPQNKDGKIFSNWWLPPQAVPDWHVACGCSVLYQTFLSSNQETQKNTQKCLQVHSRARTNTHTPCGPKAPLCFYGFGQWEGLWGWTVTTLLLSVHVCVYVCACQLSREGGAHRVTSCLWKQLAFTRICSTYNITNTHTLYSCSLTHTLAPTYTHTYCICIYVDYIRNWENQFFLMGSEILAHCLWCSSTHVSPHDVGTHFPFTHNPNHSGTHTAHWATWTFSIVYIL